MNKHIKAIAKLNELTQHGELEWEIVSPPDRPGDKVEVAYRTEYEGKKLRLFRLHYKDVEFDRMEWQIAGVLQILDDQERAIYEFPWFPGNLDLLESVEYKNSGAGELIDKLASLG